MGEGHASSQIEPILFKCLDILIVRSLLSHKECDDTNFVSNYMMHFVLWRDLDDSVRHNNVIIAKKINSCVRKVGHANSLFSVLR